MRPSVVMQQNDLPTSLFSKCSQNSTPLMSHLINRRRFLSWMLLAAWGLPMNMLVEILRDEEYEKRIANSQFPAIFDETINLTSGFEARVKLLLPPDQITKAQSRSLPLLIKVYGGPGSQIVNDEYSAGFEEFLVTTRHYAVLKIDGRGSTSRGWKYRSAIYGALGTVEISDQIETTRYNMKNIKLMLRIKCWFSKNTPFWMLQELLFLVGHMVDLLQQIWLKKHPRNSGSAPLALRPLLISCIMIYKTVTDAWIIRRWELKIF
uniref:Peptidase_S9 domain-containing protein n=1 Tax=Heterorhabditis bacteriophora TaxID=37862 RepID=A0A1I7WHN5_HETBA